MDDCLFCKISQGQIPSQKVYEDNDVFAFRDINPQAPVHVLAVPKRHLSSMATADNANLIGTLLLRCADIARSEGLEEGGYRLITNHGEDAGQTVHHLHFHIMGGRPMGWPPG